MTCLAVVVAAAATPMRISRPGDPFVSASFVDMRSSLVFYPSWLFVVVSTGRREYRGPFFTSSRCRRTALVVIFTPSGPQKTNVFLSFECGRAGVSEHLR